MSTFTVGQIVTVMRVSAFMDSSHLGKKGRIERYDRHDNSYLVRFDGGGSSWAFPGDLKARGNPAAPATPYQFKPGDQGLTAAGKGYEVLASVSRPEAAEYPLLVRIDGASIEEYTLGGRFLAHSASDSRNLLPPKRRVRTYVNVYEDGTSCGHPTEEEARNNASPAAFAVAREVIVEVQA